MRVAVILKCLNQQQTRMSKVLQYIVLSAYARQNVSFCFFFFVAVVLQREHLEAQPAHINTELKDQWI